jgi:RND family efflux transporter MFP subunit
LFAIQPPERDLVAEAKRDAATAEAELTVATQRAQRLERLLAEGAASARAVEEARGQLKIAEATAAAARARAKEIGSSPSGTGAGIVVRAPLAGVLQSVTAAPGQTVAASAPLFEVVQTDALWVRVPLFVGERNGVDVGKPVTVVGLGGGPALSAVAVTGPPSADPTTATSDLFYALQSPGSLVRPGERVSVQVPLTGSEQALVVPTDAVLYDMNGGSWVYEATGPTTFVRRRIEIRTQVGYKTLIARGLEPGKKIVTAGAIELFGTEFGAGK